MDIKYGTVMTKYWIFVCLIPLSPTGIQPL
jgi:hypothetical protein